MSLQPGTQLGPYRVEDAAGAGGMGEVYRAVDTRLDRKVAIKVLPAHFSSDPSLRQRFDREAKTISSLQHPHICSLYDVGHENGIDFLVMEYLEGDTLAARLAQGALPAEDALRIAVQVTEALEAAHRSGVIHRDLKPGNVMLTRAGAKLLDFGLAKMSEAAPTDSSTFTKLGTQQASGPLTEKGTVLGTFQYMSPEQLEGRDADARSDIFALGALMYEMVTGKKAFEGKSQASLIAAIMTSQPQTISAIQPMTPPALDRVIRTCLEKDPENRWQTAHDVALQLKWIHEGGSGAGIPRPVAARRRSRERAAWVVAAVAIAAAGVLGAQKLLAPRPAPETSTRFHIEAPEKVSSFGSPRISPDGKFIAFDATDDEGRIMIWLRPMNTVEAHPIPGTENTGRPCWSPDSRNIAFFADGKLKRVPIAGGPPVTVCEFARGSDAAWGDGVILFDAQAGDSIQAVAAGGGTPYAATTLDHARGETGHGWPHFMPDGKHFVFIAFEREGPAEIRLGEIGSMETRLLTHGDSRVEYLHPGYLVFERSGTLLAQRFDVQSAKLSGDAFALTEGIGTGDVGLAHFSGSDTGTLIYTSGDSPQRQLLWVDRNGRELKAEGQPGAYQVPALSPDGKQLAVSIPDPQSGNSDVWTIDLERGTLSRFTFDPATDRDPVWSPDGSQIAFFSTRDAGRGIYTRSTRTAEADKKMIDLRDTRFASPGDWSRDGKTLFVHLRDSTGLGIVSYEIAGAAPTPIVPSPFNEGQPRLSPDGRFLAYSSDETSRFDVYMVTIPPSGGKWQISTAGGTEPTWRNDGRELFYTAPDRSLMAVDITLGTTPQIGVPRKLFLAPVPRSPNTRNRYIVSADGQKFLLLALLDRDRVPPTTVILNWTAELRDR